MTTSDATDELDDWKDLRETSPRTVAPLRPLMSQSFLCLLAVQFLTVLNDNAFGWLARLASSRGPQVQETLRDALMDGEAPF